MSDGGAIDLHHTHCWRSSAGGDIPVTPTGAAHRSDAGQLYVEVRRRDGLTGVPKEELFPARIGAAGAAGPVVEHVVEITVFTKRSGTLSKSIELIDGKIAANADACSMANGLARRVPIDIGALETFADLINAFTHRDAYALGRIKEGHPAKVRVVATHKLNGGHDPDTIARNQAFLGFDISKPGLALLDTDYKAAPEAVRRRIEAAGVWPILCEVLPQLALVARVVRASTSSGLRNRDTGETFPGSGGSHTVIPILDAADLRRFLYDLFDRMWFAGLGWGMVSGCGSFLERSPIDKYVGTPERLIFEAPPVIKAPLEQSPRLAVAYPGGVLDTLSACPPLTDAERTEVKRLRDAERGRLKPEMEATRAAWSQTHVRRMVAGGMAEAQARAHVARWADANELSGDFPLVFDDSALGATTVADVLAAPARYVGKTLADPFEGLTYGRNIAIVYQRPDRKLWIYSVAHGETKYTLAAPPTGDDEAEVNRLLGITAELEYARALKETAKQLGVPPKALDHAVKAKRDAPRAGGSEPNRERASWLNRAIMDEKGRPLETLANTLLALRAEAELADVLAYDELLRAAVIVKPLPLVKGARPASRDPLPRPAVDEDISQLQEFLQWNGLPIIGRDIVHQAVDRRAREFPFHRLRDWLEGLKWDRKNRLDGWLTYYLGAESSDYHKAIGRMFLIAMVARVFEPGCKADYVLILQGAQGELKSAVCKVLGGDYFSDNIPDIRSKDASQHVRGLWLIELPELSALGRADIEAWKAFITRTDERYRPFYGRRETIEPRQCVFVGTTNRDEFLHDETGNRRFWPALIGQIDLDALIHDREQLFAEAVERYRAKERWWPDREFEREIIAPQQEARREIDDWTAPIGAWLERTTDNRVEVCAVGRSALGFLVDAQIGTADQRRIARALLHHGWKRGRDGRGRYFSRP